MTQQNNEDLLLDLYKIHAYIPNDADGNPLTPFGNFCAGYEAAKADSESILQEQQNTIAELKAHINVLREALEKAMNDDAGWYSKARQALSSTPAQHINDDMRIFTKDSLQAHDDEVIELLNKTLQELLKRGYEIGCQEYLIDSLPNSNKDKKTINFYGKA